LSTAVGAEVEQCRGAVNRLGFAIQLCTLRWQGYFLSDTRNLPSEVIETILRYAEKIMKSRIATAVFVNILLSIPPDMAAQSKFITFDVPGEANGLFPESINPAGGNRGIYH